MKDRSKTKQTSVGIERSANAFQWRREGLKLREIGKRLGVSPERARQLVRLGRLREEKSK